MRPVCLDASWEVGHVLSLVRVRSYWVRGLTAVKLRFWCITTAACCMRPLSTSLDWLYVLLADAFLRRVFHTAEVTHHVCEIMPKAAKAGTRFVPCFVKTLLSRRVYMAVSKNG